MGSVQLSMPHLLSALETEFLSPVTGVLSLTHRLASLKVLCTNERPLPTMVGWLVQ